LLETRLPAVFGLDVEPLLPDGLAQKRLLLLETPPGVGPLLLSLGDHLGARLLLDQSARGPVRSDGARAPDQMVYFSVL
jgi:hypothetical protein